jgi:hypothetical protein
VGTSGWVDGLSDRRAPASTGPNAAITSVDRSARRSSPGWPNGDGSRRSADPTVRVTLLGVREFEQQLGITIAWLPSSARARSVPRRSQSA